MLSKNDNSKKCIPGLETCILYCHIMNLIWKYVCEYSNICICLFFVIEQNINSLMLCVSIFFPYNHLLLNHCLWPEKNKECLIVQLSFYNVIGWNHKIQPCNFLMIYIYLYLLRDFLIDGRRSLIWDVQLGG